MQIKSSARHLLLALAVVLNASACARTPPSEQKGNSTMSDAVKTGRTIDGYTYTDAPVDVKLGPNTFRIPANYLDSQIAPWPGEGVSLVIEWPELTPTAPGARAHPRTNDFLKEISLAIDYVDRVPIETLLDRLASNGAVTAPDSVERGDPRSRLDLRAEQPEQMGLTPYTIDEEEMAIYGDAYTAHYGSPPPRNPLYEDDWYVARGANGALSTLIKCDSKKSLEDDGVRLDHGRVVATGAPSIAGCHHYIVDTDSKLSIRISYKRAFIKDWRRIEQAAREILTFKVNG